VAKKTPNPIDKHVGSRVRMRRMMLGITVTVHSIRKHLEAIGSMQCHRNCDSPGKEVACGWRTYSITSSVR